MKIEIKQVNIRIKWWQVLVILTVLTIVIMGFIWVMKDIDLVKLL